MRKLVALLFMLVLAVDLTGCSMQRSDAGLLAGGVAGGVAGHALTGSTAGTVVGAVGGAYVGHELAKED